MVVFRFPPPLPPLLSAIAGCMVHAYGAIAVGATAATARPIALGATDNADKPTALSATDIAAMPTTANRKLKICVFRSHGLECV